MKTYAFEYSEDCFAVFEADCGETALMKAEFWQLVPPRNDDDTGNDRSG